MCDCKMLRSTMWRYEPIHKISVQILIPSIYKRELILSLSFLLISFPFSHKINHLIKTHKEVIWSINMRRVAKSLPCVKRALSFSLSLCSSFDN